MANSLVRSQKLVGFRLDTQLVRKLKFAAVEHDLTSKSCPRVRSRRTWRRTRNGGRRGNDDD